MDTECNNLDALLPQDRSFKLNGQVFIVPGEVSVQRVLEITQMVLKIKTDPEAASKAIDAIWQAIAYKNKNRKKEDFTEKVTMSMLAPLMEILFRSEKTPKSDKGAETTQEVFDNSKNESGR